MKIRVIGLKKQVETLIASIEDYSGLEIISVSKPYPQTRYDKKSKQVAVYVEIKDYESEEK